jgi:methylmalonyl-CoA mutase cobalamin-binding subunit
MPPKDAVKLEEKHGVHKVYLPDTPMETIIEGIRSSVCGDSIMSQE